MLGLDFRFPLGALHAILVASVTINTRSHVSLNLPLAFDRLLPLGALHAILLASVTINARSHVSLNLLL